MNLDPDKRYLWFDKDGNRCSPRHTTLKAALNFYRNWPTSLEGRWGTNKETGDREWFPTYGSHSSKRPVDLKIGEWIVRELSDDEKKKTDQIRSLLEEGLV